MTEEQFKQHMEVMGDILESVQSIEDMMFDANIKDHQKKVEWNLWEIHNLAKFAVKGRNATLDNLPENRPSRDAERGTKSSEEQSSEA
jgi:hypothetical protein|tara:strand:- start:85 stop:348 length:264 start_codon:yes stop_codon:yes gene_type:complete